MATAHKLPSGSWRCQVYAGKSPDGRRQYRSFTALTKKEAEYMAAEFSMHYKEISRDTTAMTLAEAMDKYIAAKDGILSPSTIRGYDIIRRKHLQGLMDVRLNRITPAMVQEAINLECKSFKDEKGKEHTLTPKSVYNTHGFLSAVLREYHPGLRLNTTLPQKQRTEQHYLEPDEIGVLLNAIKGNEMEIPILLALWLSLRASEITGLTWRCVDFERNAITVKQAKVRDKDNQWVTKATKTTNSTRTISAPNYIMDLLTEARGDDGPEDFVVKIKLSNFHRRLSRILKRNNLPQIRFHDLRHTNASVMALLNVPNIYAQRRGGWATPKIMQQIYQHTMESKKNSVDDAIDSYFYSLMQHQDAGETPQNM